MVQPRTVLSIARHTILLNCLACCEVVPSDVNNCCGVPMNCVGVLLMPVSNENILHNINLIPLL
jgi:hypothetical protein